MERILQGYSRVVAILATGEGKSLLYQLPTQLAYAAITVVLVPLVALKFGM
jgi:superfamily II DNA helicase RecQ